MWASQNDHFNECGQAVRLYQPILYGRTTPNKSDVRLSFVGGKPVTETDDDESIPICSLCAKPLHLLAQVYIASYPPASGYSDDETKCVDRIVQLFACNKASCIQQLFKPSGGEKSVNKLAYGGSGVVVCRRRTGVVKKNSNSASKPVETYQSTAPTKDGEDDWGVSDDTNDWGDTAPSGNSLTDNNNNMDELEAQLAALEASSTLKADNNYISKKSNSKKTASRASDNGVEHSFMRFELSTLQEPVAFPGSGNDDEDVGMVGSSDDKIQKMLARYMDEEDDEMILGMLRGNTGGGTSAGGTNAEKDERLSEEDRALFTYTDRIKRSPQQVIRYAYGGQPLWSIPVLVVEETKPAPGKKGTQSLNKLKCYGIQEPIPPCPCCGSERMFEMQVLPSLLHVLQVDQYVVPASGNEESKDQVMAYTNSGMNWGNIAIYSCPRSTCDCSEEFVVVQDSVDDLPSAPPNAQYKHQEDVVIDENAMFDVDEDDDMDDKDDMDEENDEDKD